MTDMTIDDVLSHLGDLESRIDGLADEFDDMGDDHDALTWYVAEMSQAMPTIVATIRALAMAMGRIAREAGVDMRTPRQEQLGPYDAVEVFTQPNRAQRRQAERQRRNGHGHV